ncbi:MAG: SpoIIIAH-like family protein [Clostridiales bacterium]|nr:SpoIIIAH-like family protein [Clostridiales bacterium]
MKANKKKIIILVSLVLLLVATGVLNYFLTVKNNNNDPLDVDATPTFFSTFREDRTNMRAQEILYLDDIIASANTDEVTMASAQEKKISIVDAMETELALEGLIKSKGFEDCVVTITKGNVNIVVMKEEVTAEEAAQILDVVVTQTEYKAKNVTIIPYV